MQNLIASYKKSIKETKESLEIRIRLFENKFSDNVYENAILREAFIEKYDLGRYYEMHPFSLSEDIQILRGMLSSMRFSLSMMNREMKVRRNIEKLNKENREVSFDPSWISRRKDARAEVHEANEESKELALESKNQKERLINSMTKNLTSRQKEMLEMASTGYTHEEIAEILDVQKSTVSNTLSRAKEKIRKEGWFMP